MTKEQIELLFKKTIDSKGIGKKANLSKQVVYNYRHRPTISFGDKIEFLLSLNLIDIVDVSYLQQAAESWEAFLSDKTIPKEMDFKKFLLDELNRRANESKTEA